MAGLLDDLGGYSPAEVLALLRSGASSGDPGSRLSDLYGVGPDGASDLEFRRGATGLEAGRRPTGVHGLLDDISSGSDAALSAVDRAAATAKANGGRQSALGWLLGHTMASTVPSLVGSAARVAKAPLDYVQGRDSDLRAADALLALPAAGPASRAVAPALRLSPEAASVLGTGGAGYAYGHGIASEANATDSGGRITLPNQRTRAEFEAAYNVPRPELKGIDQTAMDARAAFERSPAYQSLVDQKKAVAASNRANDIEREARRNYAETQAAHDRKVKDWEVARDAAWNAERRDYQSRLKAFQNQGFWDRNPDVKPYAMGAAYAMPAIFGAGSAIQRSRTQQRLADEIMGADIQRSAAASSAADKYLNPTLWQRSQKAIGTGLAAGAPFELRSIGDAADAVFAPEGSGAQARAQKHFADPLKYIADGSNQLLTGAMIYGMGNKAGSLVTRDAKPMLAGTASINAPAIEAAGARRLATIERQASLDDAARQAKQAAAMADVKNRGLLAQETGNAVLAEQAAASARRRSGAQAGLLDDLPPPPPPERVKPQAQPVGQSPQPEPLQSQTAVSLTPPETRSLVRVKPDSDQGKSLLDGLTIPSGMKPNPNWPQHSDAARGAVLDWLKRGGHLGKGDDAAMKAKDVLAAIGDSGVSVQTTQGALKRLRDVLSSNGLDPAAISPAQLRKVLKELPSGYFAGPAIAIGAGSVGGLLDWGN